MLTRRNSTSEIVRRGAERYEREIRQHVEDQKGRMLALDADSGQYAVAEDSLTALNGLKAKAPGATTFLVRIGYPTAVHLGGRATER